MSSSQTATARHGRYRGPLLLAATSLLALLAGEVVLRIVFSVPPRWVDPQESYVFDEEIGHRLAPGQSSFTHDKAVRTNAHGFRAAVAPAERPAPGTLRVLALGDSQTFGNGLEERDTWPSRLQRELEASAAGAPWEVLNLGIPATDTWQHEILVERALERYRPDLVVLAFYVNDVQRSFTPRRRSIEADRSSRRIAYALKRSALLLAGRNALRALRQVVRPARGALAEHHVITGERDEIVEQGWEQVDRSLGAMRRAVERAGARFVLLVLPRRDQVAAAAPPRAYQERIGALAGKHGIPVVDALEPLRRAYEEHGGALFIPWDGHNSAVANETIAEALARHLVDGRARPPAARIATRRADLEAADPQ